MGSYQSHQAISALHNNDFEKVADLTLAYYDKLYENSLSRRPVRKMVKVNLPSVSAAEHAQIILNHAFTGQLI